MMVMSHVATGALAGRLIESPVIAFLLGIAIHFIFDKVPHYLDKTIETTAREKVTEKRFYLPNQVIMGWSGAFLFAVILALLAPKNNLPVFAGAIGGFVVDPILLVFPALRDSKFGKWHINRQRHGSAIRFLIPDFVAIVGFSLLVIFWR